VIVKKQRFSLVAYIDAHALPRFKRHARGSLYEFGEAGLRIVERMGRYSINRMCCGKGWSDAVSANGIQIRSASASASRPSARRRSEEAPKSLARWSGHFPFDLRPCYPCGRGDTAWLSLTIVWAAWGFWL
jgi:hypothetical protein